MAASTVESPAFATAVNIAIDKKKYLEIMPARLLVTKGSSSSRIVVAISQNFSEVHVFEGGPEPGAGSR
jgi:hypothetical protein